MNTLKKIIIGIMLLSSVISVIVIGAYSQNLMNGLTHSQILLDESEYENAIRDDFSFINVYLAKDLLYLKISYSGGCVSHDFSLLGSGVFLESNPVKTYAPNGNPYPNDQLLLAIGLEKKYLVSTTAGGLSDDQAKMGNRKELRTVAIKLRKS